MNKTHLVVIGGGFGGVKCALELTGNDALDITLISAQTIFCYYPSLYHTATGGRSAQSAIGLQTIFKNRPVNVVNATAKTLDRQAKTITTDSGESFNYDIIVCALGVITNYFNIKGLEEYSFGIKSPSEAQALKNHLHRQLMDERRPDLNYVVIGGGPTGVELAGSLGAYLKLIMSNHGIAHRPIHVDLVEAQTRLLPTMPVSMSRVVARRLKKLGVSLYLGQSVKGETADNLRLNDKLITSHSVVWTAGVTNNPFFSENNFDLTSRGKVVVDPYLRADSNIYVIGDNANTPYSGLAQTALTDAEFVAVNINRQLRQRKLKPYRPKQPVYAVPSGHKWAVVDWRNHFIYGRLGWTIRTLADANAFRAIESWVEASQQWMTEFGEQEECPVCAKAISK
jgi:NADH dehydrogenase